MKNSDCFLQISLLFFFFGSYFLDILFFSASIINDDINEITEEMCLTKANDLH